MPDRITLSRKSGWQKPAAAVVVSRPTIWGNPWDPRGYLHCLGTSHPIHQPMTAHQAVSQYRDWLGIGHAAISIMPALNFSAADTVADHLHGRRQIILSRLHELRGRDLCCWCKPGTPCHADILMEMANG